MLRSSYPQSDPRIKIALVGAGGFIGSHLLEALLERTAWQICAVDLDFSRVEEFRKNSRCEFVQSDISESATICKVVECPIVVNLAAICIPSRYMNEAGTVIESNFTKPALLADACAKAGAWLIYFSTSEVYGKTSADALPLLEDGSPLIQGPVQASRWSYSVAKQLSERYIASLENLTWTVLRPFNFIGPRMDFMPGIDGDGIPRVLANFSSALVLGTAMTLVNGGSARRTFTSVHDAVDFIFALFEHPEASAKQAFNIGNVKNETSILGLSQQMQKIYSQIKNVPIESLPKPRNLSGVEYYGEGYEDSLRRIPSMEKARRLLDFEAKISLENALRESLEWFSAHYGKLLKK
ncbi:MAG: NAD-dependent epimerase/dehydratase family protein [Fibrobacteraceae bacterium]|nr:NAD-dependent epimerase/dehydratase family protein [Fibrobacteraceae bacterium]